MPINIRDFLRELKVGMFSVYPSISDVIYSLSIRVIPWFDVVHENEQKQSLAIVGFSDATKIIRFNNLLEKIEDASSLSNTDNSNFIFAAITPALIAWIEESNSISCARTLTSLFAKLAENENESLSNLVDDMAWQLKEEFKKSTNRKTKDALLLSIENLEIKNKESTSSIPSNFVNYLSEPPPKAPSNHFSNTAITPVKSTVFPEGDSYIKGLIDVRVQSEIKGTQEKDSLLWNACLVETKNELSSSVLLYRVARTKFLIKLNSELLIVGNTGSRNSDNINFSFCTTLSEASKLAFSS